MSKEKRELTPRAFNIMMNQIYRSDKSSVECSATDLTISNKLFDYVFYYKSDVPDQYISKDDLTEDFKNSLPDNMIITLSHAYKPQKIKNP